MTAAALLIPELEDIARRGDPKRRAVAVQRIADLFVDHAQHFNSDYVRIFDQILGELVPTTELRTRAEIARRLSPLPNAPERLVMRLANDDEINVAGPILINSPLIGEETLVEIARLKGQSHLSAIAERPLITTAITDIIMRRGDREVVRTVAGNGSAKFSDGGYSKLIKRASEDGILAVAVGQRGDISAPLLKQLLTEAADIVRRRIMTSAHPDQKEAMTQVVAELSGQPNPMHEKRNFVPAQKAILLLHHAGQLNEASLFAFATERNHEECVAAISAMSGTPIATVHRLVLGERADPILILCKALGFEWETARALILLRRSANRLPSAPDLEAARLNFEHLSASTAQRVLQFWRVRREQFNSAGSHAASAL